MVTRHIFNNKLFFFIPKEAKLNSKHTLHKISNNFTTSFNQIRFNEFFAVVLMFFANVFVANVFIVMQVKRRLAPKCL